MTEVEEFDKFDEVLETHLARYIANRAKRTGEPCSVDRRYTTTTPTHAPYPFKSWLYHRAVVTSGTERVRIYYLENKQCWHKA